MNARYPEARHEAYILANYTARPIMERQYDQRERNTWFIGDDCCPLIDTTHKITYVKNV